MKSLKILPLLFLVMSFLACKKEAENIFTMFKGVKVTFEDRGPYAIVDNAILNDGDSVNVYFTITSEDQDMFTVAIDSTEGNGRVERRNRVTNENERRSYSGVIRHKMQRDGKTTFRIYALNEENNFIGDGYTSITVEGRPSYIHLANRKIYTHVTRVEKGQSIDEGVVTGERKTFLSLTTGETFNYQEAMANSGKVDLGIYRLTDYREANYGAPVYNLYSTNVAENPLPELDMNGWEKRNTLFSAPITGASGTFVNNLVSSSMIQQNAEKQNVNLTYTAITEAGKAFSPGNMFYFLTPEGKYGAIYVNQVSMDEIGAYLSVSIKIQK
jgi:hypothetical protein